MTSFDDMIEALHEGNAISDDEQQAIEIDEKRQFIVPSGYNTVLAYEGDVNSQIVIFKLPKQCEGHDLTACGVKEIKWKNLASGIEGVNILEATEEDTTKWQARWTVPSEAFTQAGNIEISISIYDKPANKELGYLSYAWNTGAYSGFSVAATMSSVSSVLPAKDEILIVSKEAKNIVAPAGYNNTICNFGEIGISTIYFLMDRYFGKNNALDALNCTITLYIVVNGYKLWEEADAATGTLSRKLYTTELDDRDGLVLLEWSVPESVTADPSHGPGNVKVAIELTNKDINGKITHRWISNSYDALVVTPSVLQVEVLPGDPVTTEEVVYNLIDHYLSMNEIIFDNNEESTT